MPGYRRRQLPFASAQYPQRVESAGFQQQVGIDANWWSDLSCERAIHLTMRPTAYKTSVCIAYAGIATRVEAVPP